MTKRKNAVYGRLLCGFLAVLMALMLFPAGTVKADDEVAQIGTETYETLEAALDAANASESTEVTITLLKSCTITRSITIPQGKTYTITAAQGSGITITDTGRYGLTPNGSLTMENITFNTNGRIALNGTTDNGPFGREIVFQNVNLNMNGEMYEFSGGGYYSCAIFADSPALFVFNNCEVEIKNYPSTGAAIRWNGKNNDRGYGVEIINTTFTSDGNYAGFIGTLDMLIDNSTLNVINSRGYGSNGTFYTIQNGSKVLFDSNVDWGISANELLMTTGSTLTATNNGRSGIWARAINVDSTCTLTVENNGYSSSSNMSNFEETGSFGSSTGATSNAGITYWGKSGVSSKIEAGATVTIRNNAGSGISAIQGICNLDIQSGTITNNGAYSAEYGGGIFSIGTITVGPDVEIYNNHASKAGDDIYFQPNGSRAFTFNSVGSDWWLDGDTDELDCNGLKHMIDGWYIDVVDDRWDCPDGINDEYELNGTATVSTTIALKAAHGIDPVSPTEADVIKTSNHDTTIGQVTAGSTVPFEVQIDVPNFDGNLTVTDTMTNMTFNGDLKLNGESVSATSTGNGFTYEIPGIYRGDTITLTYSGTVLSNLSAGTELENTVSFNGDFSSVTGTVIEEQGTVDNDYRLTIVKKWVADDPEDRPETVTFNVYKDGVLDGQKTIKGRYFGDSDTWRDSYPIEEYEVGADWWVEEVDVPVNYTDDVEEIRDNVFYVYNTYEEPVIEEPESSEPESSEPSVVPSEPSVEPSEPSSEPSEPVSEPEPAEPTLPQTGQLWWPVILLLAGGAVLVAFGAFRTIRGHGRRER